MKLTLLPALLLLTLSAAAQLPFQPATATPADDAAIRKIVSRDNDDHTDKHIAPNCDWENAFGVRYNDMAKMHAFYAANVTPLQRNTTTETLETKIKFIDPATAVADVYWHRVGQLDVATHKPGPDRWGRTTHILRKEDGDWFIILTRIADLRSPYSKHFDELPKDFPVPAATLASYAGSYLGKDGKVQDIVGVSGGHLLVEYKHELWPAIPYTASEFYLFNPKDLTDYYLYKFQHDATGKPVVLLQNPQGETYATEPKQ